MDWQQAAEICRVLSDPHRLHIMRQLVGGEQCASQLLRSLSITQPTLSHHMKVMTESGLLLERKAGKRTYYAINRRTWDEFMLLLDTISNETYWENVPLLPRPMGAPAPRPSEEGAE